MLELIGRTLIRWRWPVILAWGVMAIIAALGARHTVDRLDSHGGARKPTEARITDSLLTARFTHSISEYYVVILKGPDRILEGTSGGLLDSLIAASEKLPGVQGVLSIHNTGDSSFVAPDRRSTLFLVAFSVSGDSVGKLVPLSRAKLDSVRTSFPNSDHYQVLITGRGPLDLDIRNISADDARRNETRLIPITLIILVIAFGALVAAALPVLVGVLAIVIAMAVVGEIALHTKMSVFVINMISMIGLGVGIDYSLLVVTRFREELGEGLRPHEAAARTFATAGHAVMTSGMTVVVGFSALLLTPLEETVSVGIAGLVVVALSVLLATTLLPALLAILGRQIDRPRWLASKLAWYHRPVIWEKWARTLSRHPYRALAIGALIIATLTAPILAIRIGLPSRHWWPEQTEAGAGVTALQQIGMSGYIQPVRVVVEFPEGVSATSATALRGLRKFSDSIKTDPRVREVKSLVDLQPGLSLIELSMFYSDLDEARLDYGDFLDAYLGQDGQITLLDVIPSDTVSLTTVMSMVREVRSLANSGEIPQLEGTTIRVGGYVAGALDFQTLLLARFPLVIFLVLTITALMLAIVFRSVLVPIKAVLMNSLSVAATFGITVLVFQEGYGSSVLGMDGPTSAIYILVPVIVFAVVFGLSMDYEVFLLTRIKEVYDETGKNTLATREGLSATASVITSAALIMIAVFGAFAFSRTLVMQFVGFGLAVAVFLDATVIRMVIVPSLMQIAGKWNWWPGGRKEHN